MFQSKGNTLDIDESYLRYYTGPRSDHFNGETFFNAWNPLPKKGLWDVLKWRMQGGRAEWPEKVEMPERPALTDTHTEGFKVTYIGHATILVQSYGINLLIDPVFSERCSPFSAIGPKRVSPPFVSLVKLPKIDFVFVSHNHYDHLDQSSLSWLARNRKPLFITPLGNTRLIAPCGDGCRIAALDWHQSISLGDKLSLHLTPAQHWSRRGFNDINRDLWGGCFIKSDVGKSVFYSSDSGYDKTLFATIRQKYGAPDIALLPLGAYEPRWFMKYSHMNPAESVRLHQIIGAKKSMGFHFETFQLTDEAFDAPRKALAAALASAKIKSEDFLAPYPGDFLTA